VDAWGLRQRRDDEHQDDWPCWHHEETEDTDARFLFATETVRQRLRIPLSPARAMPLLTIDAEPPQMADGSAILPAFPLAPVSVEVRLRPQPPPSADQADSVRDWLRAHRPGLRVTPRVTPRPEPAPPPVEPLQPLIALEPSRRGSLWPLLALSIGLSAALVAAILV
jgi:hypothetical protein